MPLYTNSESITTVHAVLAILNIAGNSLVFAVIMKNQDMRYAAFFMLFCVKISL